MPRGVGKRAQPSAAREVSSAFQTALLRYLDRAGGPELTRAVLAKAGCERSLEELLRSRWGGRAEVISIAEAAAELTGDRDVGRRAGEELFRITTSDEATRAYFVSLGDPAACLRAIVEYSVKMAHGRSYRLTPEGDHGCVIEADYATPEVGHPFLCSVSTGYWALAATLFGALGTALHPSCQCRGDDHCLYVIRWDPGAGAGPEEVAAADSELRRRIGTFEEMQSMAEGLARAADLPSLAERILDAADGITPAPQLLVALRPEIDGGDLAALARRGMTEEAARDLADALLSGGDPPHLAAKASLGGFGVVAAFAPDATGVADASSRQLAAFGRHAGARIEAVVSRQVAERNRQKAGALLGLAGALATATTEQEVADGLAAAIPALVGAAHSAVLRWDPDAHNLRTVAYQGPDGRHPFEIFTVDRVPALYEFASRPTPFVLDRARTTPYLAAAMAHWDEEYDVVSPLVADGEFLGAICAGFGPGDRFDRDDACARMQGAADLAGTALAKARLVEEIRHQALHDRLTGLPNRTLLEDRVGQVLAETRRTGGNLALLYLDLDRLKNINDSLGHEFGDAMIRAAAGRIAGALRGSDVLARMGGDEFVVLLRGVDGVEDAWTVADKVIDSLSRPLAVGGRDIYASASIGVALYPDDGDDYGTLLQRADISMYDAKATGRGTVSRRRPGTGIADASRRLSMETELHRAIDAGELTVAYQPQVSLGDMRTVGVEALVRWHHPRLGELPPGEFLPVAAECGLMPQLDRRARRIAFAQAGAWQSLYGHPVVAVNLSAHSVRRPETVDEVGADLEEFGVDPSGIEVEITEGLVGGDDLTALVDGLAALGVRVAIDDFGSGSSLLAHLQQLPLHTLKLDRSLLRMGQGASADSSVVGAVIGMAHSCGMAVVAVGVENPAQAGRLRRAGCDAAQGFLFGRPASASDIERILCSEGLNLGSRPSGPVRSRPPGQVVG
jgi:diguanylate cyclase (GGDEF)-like protein